jgi:sulfatase modifying factor 1
MLPSRTRYHGLLAGVVNIAPVGTTTLGVGLYGQLDLAGEVWQWTHDWQAASYGNPCTDCGNFNAATYKIMRGGHYDASVNLIQSNLVQADNATSRDYYYNGGAHGLRCARTP